MMNQSTHPGRPVPSKVRSSGHYRASVVSVDTDMMTVEVRVLRLASHTTFPDVPFVGTLPNVGDDVWVAFIEGRQGKLVAFTNEGHATAEELIVDRGLDTEYRVYAPKTTAPSGRAVLFCHPWGDEAEADPDTVALFAARLAKGDIIVTVQGGVFSLTEGETLDRVDTGGVFSSSAAISGDYWDAHQTAMDAVEAAYPGIVTEWHVVGVSWGGFSVGYAACLSTQASAGTVKSATLVAAVVDVDAFYNETGSLNFQDRLEYGFGGDFPTNSASMSLVDRSAAELARPGHWMILEGADDPVVVPANQGAVLETAIGSNAYVHREVVTGAGHFLMGVYVSFIPGEIDKFIDDCTEILLDSVGTTMRPESIPGRTFYLGNLTGSGITTSDLSDFDEVDTYGNGVKFRPGDQVGYLNLLLFRWYCFSAAEGNAQWFRLPDAWTDLERYVATNVAAATGTEDVAFDTDGMYLATMTGNVTWDFDSYRSSGLRSSQTMFIKQNGTGGWSSTWPSGIIWAAGSAPTLNTDPDTWSILRFYSNDSGTTVFGELVGTGVS